MFLFHAVSIGEISRASPAIYWWRRVSRQLFAFSKLEIQHLRGTNYWRDSLKMKNNGHQCKPSFFYLS